MSEQKDISGNAPINESNVPETKGSSGGGLAINPIEILLFLLSKWYWFVLSVLLFGGYAWYQYARSPYVYTRTATVMIKDARSKNIAGGLERFSAYSTTNVSNEILQFRSHKLMHEVINRLHADMSYTVMEGLREKELYTQAPVKVSSADPDTQLPFTLTLTPVNAREVELSDFSGNAESHKLNVNLGDTIDTPVGKLVVTPTLYYSEQWFDAPVKVRKQSAGNMESLFRNNLGIRKAEDDASILYLSLKDFSTTRAEDVLNMLITVYNEETVKSKNQIAINTTNFINDRLIIIEKELGGVESQLENYKRDNELLDASSASQTSIADKAQYSTAAKDLQIQAQMASFIKSYLTDPTKATELIPSNTGISDANIESQIALYNANKLKRDRLLEGSSDKNPVVQELNKNLNAMRQNIIRAIDNMIVSIEVKQKEAENRVDQAKVRIANIPTQQRQLLSIERQQRIKEELYLYLLNKREENALAQATTEPDARVLDPASGNDIPIAPNQNSMLMGGVIKGLAIPAVLCLLWVFFDSRIRSRKDIEDAVSVPFLGEIPHDPSGKKLHLKVHSLRTLPTDLWHYFRDYLDSLRGATPDSEENTIVVRSQGRDIISEAFRIVRTNMDFMHTKSKDMQIVTFSSFGAGAGKSYVSSNLAASFAQANKRVILIDLDIRKGTLSHRGHHQEKGMTTYLAGNATPNEIIKPNGICENLDFIPAGPLAPNPAELLLSERLETLIAELRQKYDYIFVDNVPVGIIADSKISNRIADLTIFVIRVGKLDRRMLPEVEKLYQSRQLHNMSLILNGTLVKHRRYGSYGSYGSYGYGYGYGYGYENTSRPLWKRLFGKTD